MDIKTRLIFMKRELEIFCISYCAAGAFLNQYLEFGRDPVVFPFLDVYFNNAPYMGCFPDAKRKFEDKYGNFKAYKSMSDEQIKKMAKEANDYGYDMLAAYRMIR